MGELNENSEDGMPSLKVDGARALVYLNRPEQHNRIEPADLDALDRILDTVEAAPDIRVMVLTAGGRTFSSGYHLGALADRVSSSDSASAPNRFEMLTDKLENVRVPTICGLNGSVYGGATDLALACDFRIGITGMKLLMPASRLGVHYYVGGMRRYVSRLGLGAAKKLFLTGQPVDSGELLSIGYLDQVVTPDQLQDRVDALARYIAEGAPLAVQAMKRALNQIARGQLDVEMTRTAIAQCFSSEDINEGVKAWSEKRKPVFQGR